MEDIGRDDYVEGIRCKVLRNRIFADIKDRKMKVWILLEAFLRGGEKPSRYVSVRIFGVRQVAFFCS
ncbi:hypothetical protein ACKS0A_01604 [Histoplasma ohiense]